jgi:hypothetical protein
LPYVIHLSSLSSDVEVVESRVMVLFPAENFAGILKLLGTETETGVRQNMYGLGSGLRFWSDRAIP